MTKTVELNVDLSVTTGRIKPLHGVNLGPVQMNGWMDTSARFRELGFPLTRLHDCPYAVPETVDVHSLFPRFDADPDDPANYRFAITDDYIQAILDTGSGIVYRLGETIEHHTRNKYWVHPPRDFHKWARICVNIIRHYNEGWANGFRHNIRYWEIWNEPWNPPMCWTGTDDDYFRLYEVAAKAIKAHDPTLMVGGPTNAGAIGPREFGPRFLEHCRRTGTPVDFYSWHQYTPDPAVIVADAARVRTLLAAYGFAKTESHLNEWSYLPSEGWKFNSPEKDPAVIRRAVEEISGLPGAAFIAATLIHLQDCPVDVANYYWAMNGLWGFLDHFGAPCKSYYAFRAFRALLDTPLRARTAANDPASGHALLAGRDASGRAGILLANFRAPQSFAVRVAGAPDPVSCRIHVLDGTRNLDLVTTTEGCPAAIPLSLPASSVCLLVLASGPLEC